MRFPLPPAWLLLLAITIATATTNTISLSDFSPKMAVSLTPACNTVYNEVIPGCTAADLLSGTACSKACLQGLVQITNAVQASCQKDVVSEGSVIGLFKAGLGIPVLCGVAVVTTTAGGHSAAPAPAPATESIGQSTMKVSSAAATTGSLLTDTSVAAAPSMTSVMSPPPISMTLSSAASSSSVSAPSTPSPSKSSTSTSSTTSSSSAQSTAQKSGNNQSGGGSPFDITGNSLGWHAASANLGAVLSAAALAVVLLLR